MSSVKDEQEIHSLFEAGDRALMAADLEALARIFGDDYVQYDPMGKAFSRREVLDTLRSGQVRYASIVSTGRRIRLFGEMAIVHGSESDEVEAGGRRFPVQYLYMDVVCKRDGRWQIVGSQLAKPEVEE
ncbi:MAG: nuclear transport factor 2 family protein [Terriglobales bacterium]